MFLISFPIQVSEQIILYYLPWVLLNLYEFSNSAPVKTAALKGCIWGDFFCCLLFCKRVGGWILTFTLRLCSQCWVLFLFGILGVNYKLGAFRQECVLEKAKMSFYSAYLDWENWTAVALHLFRFYLNFEIKASPISVLFDWYVFNIFFFL